MRKVIFQMMVSLNGFFEGPHKEIDWHNVDEEFNNYAIDLLNNVDTLIFGRITYELMAGYWPTPSAITKDPVIADKMNSLEKIVFSKKLSGAGWNNTKLIKENVDEEILKLKNKPGKDIAIFGSSNLALTFIQHNLIDEYRIIVSPVILGNGNTLFKGIQDALHLKLTKATPLNSGNVILFYEPARR